MLVLVAAGTLSALLLAPPVVVLGPGSLDMRLLTAKLAARAGLETKLFVGAGAQQQLWEQMYAEEYLPGGENGRPALVSSAEDRNAALQSAEALCVACDGATLSESALASVLEATPALKRVVLLSKMGVTRVRSRPLGLNKGDIEQREGEERIREACASSRVELSIVRC